MKKIVKKNYKILIGIVIGIIISTTIVYSAENILTGSDVTYSNGSSSSDNVQGAIDELYKKVDSYKEYIPNDNPNRNIVKAYKYDEDNNSHTYCITGEEESCFVTSCYDNKAKDSCPPGTIIEYKVNDNETKRFHVVHDDGDKMTLQTQKNTISSVQWYKENTFEHGPETALNALEEKTNNWTNVNTFDYSIGEEDSTLGYSGCRSGKNICEYSSYTLNKTGVKTRMITFQEAKKLGCKESGEDTCPIWMYSYLKDSKYNGNQQDTDSSNYYWLMSATDFASYPAYIMVNLGRINTCASTTGYLGARAVVEISK